MSIIWRGEYAPVSINRQISFTNENRSGSGTMLLVALSFRYAGRTTLSVSDANPKWLIGKGLKKTFLYGLERCNPAKPLVLVESFWGPPFFHEKGLQAASLMGSELTESQERCLDPFPVITLALDDDPHGIEKAGRIREQLKGKHRVLKARLAE
jgi:hypothetical protein